MLGIVCLPNLVTFSLTGCCSTPYSNRVHAQVEGDIRGLSPSAILHLSVRDSPSLLSPTILALLSETRHLSFAENPHHFVCHLVQSHFPALRHLVTNTDVLPALLTDFEVPAADQRPKHLWVIHRLDLTIPSSPWPEEDWFSDPEAVIASLRRTRQLRRLDIHIPDGPLTRFSDTLKCIRASFPALRIIRYYAGPPSSEVRADLEESGIRVARPEESLPEEE